MSISKRLLIHRVEFKQNTGKRDRDRNPVYEVSELRNVRVGVTRRVQAGQHGVIRADTMTLFIDGKYSEMFKDAQKSSLIIPKEDDVIVFEGKEYTVKGVTSCYAAGLNAGHYEVVLE